MQHNVIIRRALWVSVAINTLGVAVFLPLALGRASSLVPLTVAPWYAGQIAFTIALFAGVYAWLALQPTVHRPLIVVGGLGKLGFFLVTVLYALFDRVPLTLALQATPDLVLGAVFLWWARLVPQSGDGTDLGVTLPTP